MPQSIYDNGGMVGKTLDFGFTVPYSTGNFQNSGIWSLSSVLDFKSLNSPTSLSYVTIQHTNSTGTTITLPSGIADGDLAIVFNRIAANDAAGAYPATVVPDGWELAAIVEGRDNSARYLKFTAIVKRMTAAESSTTIPVMSGTDAHRHAVVIFRGNTPINSVQVLGSTGAILGSGTSSSNTIATSNQANQKGVGLAIGWIASFNTLSSPTVSPSVTSSSSVTPENYVGWHIQNSGTFNSSYGISASGNSANYLASIFTLIKVI